MEAGDDGVWYRSLQQFTKRLTDRGGRVARESDGGYAGAEGARGAGVGAVARSAAGAVGGVHGSGFAERRDTAIMRLFVDTGMRLAEMTGLTVADLDTDDEVAVVLGQGRRLRSCLFRAKTGQALDRYLRVRGRHEHASLPEVWLGSRGPLSTSGIREMLTRRGRNAGRACICTCSATRSRTCGRLRRAGRMMI